MNAAAEIGFGTWPLGGRAYGAVNEADATVALERALELGVRVFDTANIYGDGRAERLLGEVAGGEAVVIVTKCGYVDEASDAQAFDASSLKASVGGSLRRLRRDAVDVLLLHSPPRDVLCAQEATTTLDELRDRGLVQRTGVSLRSVNDWDLVRDWDGCHVVELIFSLLDQRMLDLGIARDAEARGIRLVPRLPLCSGFLGGRYGVGSQFGDADQRARWPRPQLDAWANGAERFRSLIVGRRTLAQYALAFAAAPSAVWAVIPGMKTVAQVEENVASLTDPLTAEELEGARAVWHELSWVVPA